MVRAHVFCLLSFLAEITDYSLSLTHPQSSLLVLLIVKEGWSECGGWWEGGKERDFLSRCLPSHHAFARLFSAWRRLGTSQLGKTLDWGCLPFTTKFRKFRLECEWLGYFGDPDRKISKIFGTSWKVVQNFQPEFPNRKYVNHLRFSPFPSPTTILMRITCQLVRVVQMVHANSDGSFSFGLFA